MLFWNGIQSHDRLRLAARPDTPGLVTWTLSDGSTTSATAAAITNDGVVSLEITGLSESTLYTYTLTSPDGTETGQCKTFPSDGPVTVAFASCQHINAFPGNQILRDEPLVFIHLGDEDYAESGTISASLANSIDQQVHYDYHAQIRANVPTKANLMHKIGFGYITDDHDALINDVVDDLTKMNTKVSWTYTQEQWNTTKDVIGNAVNVYNIARPPTIGSSDSDPLYFSFECGNTEVFVLSQIIPTLGEMRGDYPASNLLLDNQRDWLYAGLKASTKKFKLILSPKSPLENTAPEYGNPDKWADYADPDVVFQYIHDDQANWAVPGGMILGSGDYHTPQLHVATVANKGFNLVQAQCCPCARWGDIRNPGVYEDWTAFQVGPSQSGATSAAQNPDNRFQNYGIYKSYDSYCEIKCRSIYGFNIFSCAVETGSNAQHFPSQLVAI